jgi:hypothetical protein
MPCSSLPDRHRLPAAERPADLNPSLPKHAKANLRTRGVSVRSVQQADAGYDRSDCLDVYLVPIGGERTGCEVPDEPEEPAAEPAQGFSSA